MGSPLGESDADAWVTLFATSFAEARGDLDELDRRSGDGDFGSNLLPSLEAVAATLDGSVNRAADAVFSDLSNACMRAGGTSGPLFGILFKELSRALSEPAESGLRSLSLGMRAGVSAVSRLGGAQPGDKTMLDAMEPAALALEDAAARDFSPAQGLQLAAAAARAGAEATAELTARRGRASYVGDASLGVRDPGAVAVWLFFDSGARALASRDGD
jgi:dihydroxyacetone kinase phosphoprotein-dependent L subunit